MMCLQRQRTGDGEDGWSDGLNSRELFGVLVVCGVETWLAGFDSEVEQVTVKFRCTGDCVKITM